MTLKQTKGKDVPHLDVCRECNISLNSMKEPKRFGGKLPPFAIANGLSRLPTGYFLHVLKQLNKVELAIVSKARAI